MKNLSLHLSYFDGDVLFKRCEFEAPVWTMLSLLMNISANLLCLSLKETLLRVSGFMSIQL